MNKLILWVIKIVIITIVFFAMIFAKEFVSPYWIVMLIGGGIIMAVWQYSSSEEGDSDSKDLKRK